MSGGHGDRESLAELTAAGAYGTVLVVAAVAAVTVSEVELGVGAELLAGVGVATWVAHLFAELLGDHVRHDRPLDGERVRRATIHGLPILLAPVLPAVALLLGRLDVVDDTVARRLAIGAAVGQLFAIGAAVARIAPGRRSAVVWFALATLLTGVAVAAVTALLKH